MFYINTSHSLACRFLIESEWEPCYNGSSNYHRYAFSGLSAFTAAPDSRHLSVAGAANLTGHNAFLLYEPSQGGVNLLNGSFVDNDNTPMGSPPSWIWTDASSTFDTETGYQHSAPFVASFDFRPEYLKLEAVSASKYANGSYTNEWTIYPSVLDVRTSNMG